MRSDVVRPGIAPSTMLAGGFPRQKSDALCLECGESDVERLFAQSELPHFSYSEYDHSAMRSIDGLARRE